MRALELRHSAQQSTFGQRLRASREHARLTPQDLAILCKVTEKRIHNLEAGGGAPPDHLLVSAMAYALGVPKLWLMAGDLAGAKFKPVWYTPTGGQS